MLAAWGNSEGPSEQQEGRVGFQNHIFNDFAMILGLHFESLLRSDGLEFVLFQVCVLVAFRPIC